jgi:hypothetical protein
MVKELCEKVERLQPRTELTNAFQPETDFEFIA